MKAAAKKAAPSRARTAAKRPVKAAAKKAAPSRARTAAKRPVKAAAKKAAPSRARTAAKRPVKAAAKKAAPSRARTAAKRPVKAAAKKAAPSRARTAAKRPVKAAAKKTAPKVIDIRGVSADMIKLASMIGQATGGHLGQGFTRLCRHWAAQMMQNKMMDGAGRQYLDMFVKMTNLLDIQENRVRAR